MMMLERVYLQGTDGKSPHWHTDVLLELRARGVDDVRIKAAGIAHVHLRIKDEDVEIVTHDGRLFTVRTPDDSVHFVGVKEATVPDSYRFDGHDMRLGHVLTDWPAQWSCFKKDPTLGGHLVPSEETHQVLCVSESLLADALLAAEEATPPWHRPVFAELKRRGCSKISRRCTEEGSLHLRVGDRDVLVQNIDGRIFTAGWADTAVRFRGWGQDEVDADAVATAVLTYVSVM